MPITELKLLTVDDLAELFRVRVETIDGWVKAGRLPRPIRPGHRRYWRPEDIQDHLAKLAEAQAR